MAEGHQMAVWTPQAAPSAPALSDQFVRQGIDVNVTERHSFRTLQLRCFLEGRKHTL